MKSLIILCSLLLSFNYAFTQMNGGAVIFDGDNDYLIYQSMPSLGNSYTMECYFISDSTLAAEQTIWNFDDVKYSPWLGVNIDSSLALYDDTNYVVQTSAGFIKTGQVYHIAYVWDGTQGRIYVDGNLELTHTAAITTPDGQFHIGNDQGGLYPLVGTIDEFLISDSVRYSGSSVSIPATPWTVDAHTIAYWRFEECNGQLAEDLSSNSLDLQLGLSNLVDAADPGFTNPERKDSIQAETCDYFVFGGDTLLQTGVYSDSIDDGKGCDSIIVLFLTVKQVNTLVTQNGNTLSAIASNSEYVWLDCGNSNSPIAGAITRSFTPDSSGSYAVVITTDSCSDTSTCRSVTIPTSFIADKSATLFIFPDPANDQIWVECHDALPMDILLHDVMGRVWARKTINTSSLIDISGLHPGIYIVRAQREGEWVVAKFMK